MEPLVAQVRHELLSIVGLLSGITPFLQLYTYDFSINLLLTYTCTLLSKVVLVQLDLLDLMVQLVLSDP